MTGVSVALALGLPALLGGAVLLAFLGRPSGRAALPALLGTGWVLGCGLLSLLIAAAARGAPSEVFGQLAPWLGAIAVIGIAAGWRWRTPVAAWQAPEHGPTASWMVWPLLVLIAAHGVLLTLEAARLPTLPWDAWTTWVGKARLWFSAESWTPFLTPDEWLRAQRPEVRAALAPHYPDAIPRLVVWMASAADAFDSRAYHLLWPALWFATAAGIYGQLRIDGLRADWALGAVFAALSLPLVSAHVALAGYADLWIAALLLFAVLHVMRALRRRSLPDAALASLFALLLPTIKLEGAVWLLCLAAAAAWSLLPVALRWVVPVLTVIVVAAGMAMGGLPIPAPGLGVVTLSWGAIEIPTLGRLALFWRPVSDQVLASLFALPNWHLLWYAAPIVFIWRRARLRDPDYRAVAAFLALALLFLFVLFFFTDASAWAENLTSVNRVLLHIAPLAAVMTVRLLAPAPSDTPPASAR